MNEQLEKLFSLRDQAAKANTFKRAALAMEAADVSFDLLRELVQRVTDQEQRIADLEGKK